MNKLMLWCGLTLAWWIIMLIGLMIFVALVSSTSSKKEREKETRKEINMIILCSIFLTLPFALIVGGLLL